MSLGKQTKKKSHNIIYILKQLFGENCNDQDWTITTGDMSLLIGDKHHLHLLSDTTILNWRIGQKAHLPSLKSF